MKRGKGEAEEEETIGCVPIIPNPDFRSLKEEPRWKEEEKNDGEPEMTVEKP